MDLEDLEDADYEGDESMEEWSEHIFEKFLPELEMEMKLEKEMGWTPECKEENNKMTIPILTDEVMEKDDFHPYVCISKKDLFNIYNKFFDQDKMSFQDFSKMVLLGYLPEEWTKMLDGQ